MIYFVRSGDYIKIGISNNVIERVKQIQTCSPLKVELIKFIGVDDELSLEKAFHGKFVADKAEGEWFKISEELLDFIEGLESEEQTDKRTPFSTSLFPHFHTALKIEAARKGCNVNEFLEELISNYLQSK